MRVYWIVSVAAAAGLSSVWFNESLASLAQGSKTGGSDAPSSPAGLVVDGRLSVGDSGLLTNGSLVNAYPFELSSPTRVTFDLQSTDIDTYLYLFDAEGNLVEENDDRSENNFNALLEVSLEPGRYVVLTSSYSVLEQGGYDLEARGVTLGGTVPLTEVAFAGDLRPLEIDLAIARLAEPPNGPWRSVLQVYRGGATGSATVLNAGGLLLTNYHVIEDEVGDEPPVYVGVALDIDRPVTPLFEATIERTSPDDDLALLQIRSSLLGGDLPDNLAFAPLSLGDVNDLSLGDPVTVLGFPGTTAIQGQGASYLTLTQGVVSAMISRFSKRYDLISDVAVNSGNSGGAALNSKGELVAVPTGTVSESRGGDLDSASVLRTVEAIPSEWFSLINR